MLSNTGAELQNGVAYEKCVLKNSGSTKNPDNLGSPVYALQPWYRLVLVLYVCTVESDSLKMKQFVFSDFFPLNQPKTLVFQWVVGWFCLLCMRTDRSVGPRNILH